MCHHSASKEVRVPNLLVRDVPKHVVQTLKQRAAHHRWSLQQEKTLEQAAQQAPDAGGRCCRSHSGAACRDRPDLRR
ncbi:MAG: FitA-like ribbon-helix-helix domain-containing protein [Chloroflexota bacterium]